MTNRIIPGGIYYFKSDFDDVITPRPIPEGSFYIEVITSGNVCFGVDSARRQYGVGTIFWHEGGDWTLWEVGDAGRYSALVLAGRYREEATVRPARIASWRDVRELELFAALCMRDLFDDNIDSNQLAEYMMGRFYYEAYCSLHRKDTRSLPLPLVKAMEILNQHISHVFSVKELARQCHVSSSYLFLLFREHLHISPHQYILNRRFKHAKYLLAGTSMPVKSIMAECGFSSIEHFHRAFKDTFGMSPVKFRQTQGVFSQNLCPVDYYIDEVN